MTKCYQIICYSDNWRVQLLTLWEESVLATHNFIQPADFLSIKAIVQTINFNDFEVYCLVEDSVLLGFVGVLDQKIKMLFLSPDQLGKGFGKKLLQFALHELKAYKVDVNEQNQKAVEFYLHFGFKTYERTDKDDQRNDYPLLRMKLNTN